MPVGTYLSPKNLDSFDPKYCNQLPMVIHRTLLFDSDFPTATQSDIASFEQFSHDFVKVLWREPDLLDILTPSQQRLYTSYTTRIQKADLARYCILQAWGGVYADFDVQLNRPLSELILLCDREFLAVEETSLSPQFRQHTASYPIRQILPEEERPEATLRIANYIIASIRNSTVWEPVFELCKQRGHLPVECDYDVIFTTGPDIVSSAIGALLPDDRICILEKASTDDLLLHRAAGHWRMSS
ncbi:glycosyltransferase [Nisaea sp.]|uniref:glycosyltransferase n=1 Tax=Nisaea sp. TaxID=2024842 RepID=UPI003297D613